MKEINMYVRGSNDKNGTSCVVILEYKNIRKIVVYKNLEGTPNRAVLFGFLNGITKLKEPCIINAYSHCHLGIRGKITGVNIDLKNKLVDLISERGHTFNFNLSRDNQEYMIELLRKTKNFKQNVIYLKDTQSSG